MCSTARNLKLLDRHLDLLPVEKQPIARWLCESWRGGEDRIPRQLRYRITKLFSYNLTLSDAPDWLPRELSLELLASNKSLIARRTRIGVTRRAPVKLRAVKACAGDDG